MDLTIEDGQIVGLIGHNGAGKSTTIKSLVVSSPQPLDPLKWMVRTSIAIDWLSKKKIVGGRSARSFLRLTANEFWELVATSSWYESKDCDHRLEELLRIFDFQSHRYEVIESFSHGMRQKVFVIAALLSDPDIWVLDEPMTGLDPQASYDLKQMMRQHADRGKTVIFSHVLEVAEQLCDKIAILKRVISFSMGRSRN